ncbi:putative reverse transcriptase domain-containing protein [Tanacetum coccineum]
MNMTLQSSIKDRILTAQKEACDESTRLQKGLDEMIEHRIMSLCYYLDRIWVPLKGDVRTLIMDEAYKSKYSVHPGANKMYYDLRDRYWWSGIKNDIAVYVNSRMEMGRDSNGYVTKLPRTSSGHDTIWVIVDRLTKSAHFLPMRKDFKMDKLARLYLNEIVARHGVPISIISDRDSQFTSRFWKSMQEAYRKPVFDMSTDTTLRPMPNNDNAPKEALYGRKCFVPPMIVGKAGEGTMIVPELVQETTGKISQIKDRLKAAHDSQPSGLHVRFALGASGGSDTVYESTLKSFKKLKRSRIAIVKVRWNSKHGLEFTWEREDQMKLKYPHLFSDSSDEWPVDWMPVSRSLSISFNDHCLKSPMLLKYVMD